MLWVYRVHLSVLVCLFLLILTTCGKDSPTKPKPPEPTPPVVPVATRIVISPPSATLNAVGRTIQLSARVLDQNGSAIAGATITWNSGNPSVATVDNQGLVTALKNGASVITVQSGGVSATASITVSQAASRIVIEPSMATLMSIGSTFQLTATVFDGNDQPVEGAVVTWQSSDETVASVNMQGLVTAVDNGSAKITATSGGASAEVDMTVQVPDPDRETLITLYKKLNGPEWKNNTNWLSDTHVDDWYGVQTNEDGRVTALNLGSNGLSGSIPIEMARLTELHGLSFEDNQLIGPVHQSLGQLTNLTHVYLYDNQLTGSIPSELGQLVNLIHLCLNSNRLTGSIPPELGRLSNLKWLHLHNNLDLAGALPAALTSLNLDALLLQGTKVCVPSNPNLEDWISQIPDVRISRCVGIDPERSILIALYNATDGENWNENTNWLSDEPLENWARVQTDASGKVTALRLYGNALSGSIPPELGQLSSLVWLDLAGNQLSGSIPPELGQLSNLEMLVLLDNLLNGNIPAELGRLEKLAELHLSNNLLTGSIPSELGNLTRLTSFSLSRNKLTGSIPVELGQLNNLKLARLDSNLLTGSLPGELGRLDNLTELDLRNNRITGAIPEELGQMSNLEVLVLTVNEFTNEIPTELAQLQKLRHLRLFGNKLTGSIPAELGQISSLTRLNLGNNQLTGSIPAALAQLDNLLVLLLRNNQLNGSIPAELGQLESLELLDLADNQLTGVIPSTLGDLPLSALWLNNNDLTGTLPAEIGQITNLNTLDLDNNPSLSGSLPRELLSLSLNVLDIYGTQLCIPGDDEFQSWYMEILHRRGGINCEEYVELKERSYLADLYHATDGPNWTNNENWLSTMPISQWFGVTTNPSGRVDRLILENNGLYGVLPSGIDKLAELKSLHLRGNHSLIGRMPRELLNLPIESLLLNGSQLCAPVDVEFQAWLTSISEMGEVLNCEETVAMNDRSVLIEFYHSTYGPNWNNSNNWLSERPIGEWYGVTSDSEGRVSTLLLRENNLSGSITPRLSQLAHLRSIDLIRNQLNGIIPAELGQLTRLEILRLGSNQLSGSIPPELGQLDELRSMVLSDNRLTGSIPRELAQLEKLSHLALAFNRLSGNIPSELGQMGELWFLNLSDNRLAGTIPSELGQLANLSWLDLASNSLSGIVPFEIGQLSKLKTLRLRKNQFVGPIPGDLGKLTNLTEFSLSSNQISGNIPVELGALTNLKYVYLDGNRLSGSLPAELGELLNLKIFALDGNNELSGPIPLSFTGVDFEQFTFEGTQLCAPVETDFHIWFRQIENRSNVTECRLSMNPEVYLTQAVQSFASPVPLVAGDPTLLRVFFATDEVVWNRPAVSASFYNDGAVVHTVDIPGGPSKIPVQIDEGSLETSANAVVPADVIRSGLEMVLEIEPVGMSDTESGIAIRIPETGRMAVDVRSVPPLNLTLVPLLWMDNPDHTIVMTTEQLTAEDDLFRSTRDLLPVREFHLNVREAFFTSVDPTKPHNKNQLLQELKMLRTADGASSHYMGIIGETGFGGVADLGGLESIAFLDEFVIAHELGHNMNLLHVPCGVSNSLDPYYPHDSGAIGAWGYNLVNNTLEHPSIPDLMGYCSPVWISDYHFKKAMNYRVMEESRITASYMSETNSMLVWGRVNESGELFLEPVFVIDTKPSLPHEDGPYRMEGFDSDGSRLFTLNFSMSEIADGEGGAFAFAIPVQADWSFRLTRVTLSGPEGYAEMTRDGDQSAALLLDRNSGEVRGILRDWPGPSSGLQATRRVLPEPGLEVIISSGIPDPADWAPRK